MQYVWWGLLSPKWSAWHLSALNRKLPCVRPCHETVQVWLDLWYEFNSSLSTRAKMLVSSVYILHCNFTILGKSLIYTTNKTGPKHLPCGTPLVTGGCLWHVPWPSVSCQSESHESISAREDGTRSHWNTLEKSRLMASTETPVTRHSLHLSSVPSTRSLQS